MLLLIPGLPFLGFLINAFFGHLGIDVANITGRPSANPSLPIELVEFKRILNGTPLSLEGDGCD